MVLIRSMARVVELLLEDGLLVSHLEVRPVGLRTLARWLARLSDPFGWAGDGDQVIDAGRLVI